MNDTQSKFSIRQAMARAYPIHFLATLTTLVVSIACVMFPEYSSRKITALFWITPSATALRNIAVLLASASALYFLTWWLRTAATQVEVTESSVIKYHGWMARKSVEMRHRNINTFISQGPLQGFMDVGDIAFSTTGELEAPIKIYGVRAPERTREIICRIFAGEDIPRKQIENSHLRITTKTSTRLIECPIENVWQIVSNPEDFKHLGFKSYYGRFNTENGNPELGATFETSANIWGTCYLLEFEPQRKFAFANAAGAETPPDAWWFKFTMQPEGRNTSLTLHRKFVHPGIEKWIDGAIKTKSLNPMQAIVDEMTEKIAQYCESFVVE